MWTFDKLYKRYLNSVDEMLKRDHLMKATEQFFCLHFWLGGSEIPKYRHSNESLRTAHDTFYLFIVILLQNEI